MKRMKLLLVILSTVLFLNVGISSLMINASASITSKTFLTLEDDNDLNVKDSMDSSAEEIDVNKMSDEQKSNFIRNIEQVLKNYDIPESQRYQATQQLLNFFDSDSVSYYDIDSLSVLKTHFGSIAPFSKKNMDGYQ